MHQRCVSTKKKKNKTLVCLYLSNHSTSEKENLRFDRENVEIDLDELVGHKFDGWDFPKFHIKGRPLDLQPCSCHKLVIGL